MIDEIGGITVDVPRPIRSNRFDCPYTAARCQTWQGWRFGKGKQHMSGERALIYTRIRENKLDPGENDLTRTGRQQQVIQAISSKLASVGTFLDLPFIGGDLMKPLATDLSAGDFIQLGWVKWRSGGSAVHCRLTAGYREIASLALNSLLYAENDTPNCADASGLRKNVALRNCRAAKQWHLALMR